MNAALLLTALFNGAWQGALLCALALLAFRLFRRLNATTMFTVWSILLAIALLLPFANYVFAPKPYVVVHRVAADAPAANSAPASVRLQPSVTLKSVSAAPFQQLPTRRVTLQDAAKAVFRFAPEVLMVLAAIAFLRLTLLARDVMRMLVARSRVRPIESPVLLSGSIARPYQFAASKEFTSPCVLGFAPALIVIPEALLVQPGAELTSVVLHEREHVRRFDDVQNVVQRFIGALAFFCPGVRIALRELALYREQICDDAAVNATGDRLSYAMTLTDLAQWAQGRGTPVPSLIFRRKHLLHRLEVLLDSAVSHSMRMNRRFAVVAAITLGIAALLVLRIQVPVIADTVEKLPAPQTHVQTYTHTHTHVRTDVHTDVHTHVHAVVHPQRHAPSPAIHHGTHVRTAQPKLATPPVWEKLPPKAPRGAPDVVAFAAANRRVDASAAIYSTPVFVAHNDGGNDLLDALAAAGLKNLPVDQLIALRDHGVSADLIRSAVSYFGRIGAGDLTYLADHGVGTSYIQTLRSGGITGISPRDAVNMMDHGVSSTLIHSALSYFAVRPGPSDLIYMADHGIGASYIDSLRNARVSVCWEDAVKMLDNGVDAAYVAKVRRTNPHATISDIIRLRNAGF